VLSSVRRVSGQPCSRARPACFGVPSTARRTQVRLRVAVLPKSARPNAVRSAAAPNHAAPAPLMSSRRILRAGLSGPVRRVRPPVACRRSAARYGVAEYDSLSHTAPRLADRRTERPWLSPPDCADSPPRRTNCLRLRLRENTPTPLMRMPEKSDAFSGVRPCRAERVGRTRFGGFAAKTVRDNEACSQARPSRAEIRG
jgi:hypothetical protein